MKKVIILTYLTVFVLCFSACSSKEEAFDDTTQESDYGMIMADSNTDDDANVEDNIEIQEELLETEDEKSISPTPFQKNTDVITVTDNDQPAKTYEQVSVMEDKKIETEEPVLNAIDHNINVRFLSNPQEDFMDSSAFEEIVNVRAAIIVNPHWQEYVNFDNGKYAVPIENFSIARQDNEDGSIDYYLNYEFSDKTTVKIEVYNFGTEIYIYISDIEKNTIGEFTDYE